MRTGVLWLTYFVLTASTAADWRQAQPGWDYQFPQDHRVHRDFKTEWWYFTGNLDSAEGRRFGFELTFFRDGVLPLAARQRIRSRFVVDDLKFAHLAVTDVAGKRFRFAQKMSRGAFGEAGFDEGDRLAWLEGWTLRMLDQQTFALSAQSKQGAVNLTLRAVKVPVLHGEEGISVKSNETGSASHYYSITRLITSGTVRVDDEMFNVSGESWFDHEWATSQLAPRQVGWDWLCLQLENGTEVMLYQMRLEDGSVDPASHGTFVAADGRTVPLSGEQFSMKPLETWKSRATGAVYPVRWRVAVKPLALEMEVVTVLQDQELALGPISYWEGAVDAIESQGAKRRLGRGYLELTGYAGPLRALRGR